LANLPSIVWQILGNLIQKVGEGAPHKNNNFEGMFSQRREAKVEVYVLVYKASKVEGCDLK
jgi:hypothetical protein